MKQTLQKVKKRRPNLIRLGGGGETAKIWARGEREEERGEGGEERGERREGRGGFQLNKLTRTFPCERDLCTACKVPTGINPFSPNTFPVEAVDLYQISTDEEGFIWKF